MPKNFIRNALIFVWSMMFFIFKIWILLHKNKNSLYCREQEKLVCLKSSLNPIYYPLKNNGMTTKQPHCSSKMLENLKKFKTILQ